MHSTRKPGAHRLPELAPDRVPEKTGKGCIRMNFRTLPATHGPTKRFGILIISIQVFSSVPMLQCFNHRPRSSPVKRHGWRSSKINHEDGPFVSSAASQRKRRPGIRTVLWYLPRRYAHARRKLGDGTYINRRWVHASPVQAPVPRFLTRTSPVRRVILRSSKYSRVGCAYFLLVLNISRYSASDSVLSRSSFSRTLA